jgi:hypothetical protein
LGADEIVGLVDAYTQGGTIDELATTFGIHRTTVMAHLERQGAPRRSSIVTGNIDEATRLYEEGWSLTRIGGSSTCARKRCSPSCVTVVASVQFTSRAAA